MPVYPIVPDEPGTPGALIDRPYQYEFRGFLFGAGTPCITHEVDGLLGSATSRDQDQDNRHGHGANPGLLLYGKRIVQFNLTLKASGTTTVENLLLEAQKAFQVPRLRYSQRLEPFVYRRPGQPDKVLYARCTKRDFQSNYEVAHGLARGSVELVAPNPIVEALEPRSAHMTVAPGNLSAQVLATNLGSFVDGSSPLIVISGPAVNPVIQNETDDDRAIRLNVNLAQNDAVRIDVQKRIVEVRRGTGGAWVRDYSIVRNDNQWWNVLPGTNTINYNRASGGSSFASNLDIYWRDTWA